MWADRVAKLRSRCRSTMRICEVLVGSAFACRRATGERETCCCKRGVSLLRDDKRYRVIGLLLVCGQTVWQNYIRDVALPRVLICAALVGSRLRGTMPLGSAKHAGVTAVCRW